MRTVKKISSETNETAEIKSLVEVYEEISASKMQDIRGEIINSRDFFEKLASLSSEIGADLEQSVQNKQGDVAVFVSAGSGLYGDLIDKIFIDFVSFINKNKSTDRIVIGKLGDEMMRSLAGETNYKFYDLVNEDLDANTLPDLLKTLVKYKRIYLFHGKFKNIVSQETWTESISGQVLGEIQDGMEMQKCQYLYEPNISDVAKVFSEEISGMIFDQTVKESRLAKYASRLMHLDNVMEKIDTKLEKLIYEKVKAVKRNGERKQMASFAGLINI